MRPTDDDESYDTITLGGVQSPGTVVLSGHDRMKNWDVRKAQGTTGASTRLHGDDVGTFKAVFYLVDDGSSEVSQFDRWDSFERLIKSTTDGAKPFALSIYHPDLARNHYTEVCNGGVSGFVHDGKGGVTVTVTFIEFRPPKAKPAAGPIAKASAGAKAVDPNAAAKRELAALVAVAKQP